MGGWLKTHVHVHSEDGTSHAFGPSDTVPAWAAKLITNPNVWDGAAPKTEDAPPPPPPPGGGAGDGDPGTGDGAGSGDTGGAGGAGDDMGAGDQPPVTLPAGLDAESTLKELRDYAKANSINLHGATSKEDVLAAIANPQ